MKKRIFSRVLALVMAMSLLSTTAFAASFANLQDAINGNDNGRLIEGTEGHYGYGSYIEGAGFEITAWSIAAEGDTPANRVVNLWSDVNFTTGDKGIVIDGNKTGQENVTINMNGNTIDANPDAILIAQDVKQDEANPDSYEIVGYDGKFYQATTNENGEKVAVEDENGNKTVATGLNNVRVLEVKNGANVTLNGKGGTLTGGFTSGNGGAAYVEKSTVTMNDVNVTGNQGGGNGGAGIRINTDSTFTMNGGSITNNYNGSHGGGLGVHLANSATLNNVTITNNAAHTHGGGVWLVDVRSVTLDGCTIAENYAGYQGGGISASNVAEFNICNTNITDNKNSGWGGGGIRFLGKGTLNLQGNNLISRNESGYAAGGVTVSTGCTLNVTGEGNELYGNTAGYYFGDDLVLDPGTTVSGLHRLNQRELKDADGHVLNGWYYDHDEPTLPRWQEDMVAKAAPEYIFTKETVENDDGTVTDKEVLVSETGRIAFKYAHNKLYTVTLHPGYENAGDPVALPGEVGQDLPTVNDPTPRPGYEFAGWVIADENGNPTDEKFDPTAPNDNGDDIVLVATWTASSSDDNNDNSGSTDTTIPGADIPLGDLPTGGADAATTTIEDEETPLAGLFTRADAIGYLWEQTGSPEADLSDFEDVPEDHYWAVAIGWAQDMGIALPDEDGNFRPDDLVLRTSDEPEGELQEFLNRYAVFAGVELEDGELFIELDGEAEDFIMGEEAQVIFDEFFAKLESALEDQAA